MISILEKTYQFLPAFLQNVATSAYGYKTRRERFCQTYLELLEELEKSQYYSQNELTELQNEKLAKLITYVYENIPYYRKLFKERKLEPEDIKTRDDLQKLPVLTKETVKNNFHEMTPEKSERRNLRIGHTSGTTGSPLEVLWDRKIEIANNAVLWRHRRWAGFNFGEKYATLLGRIVVPLQSNRRPFHRINLAWNQYLFSSFHLKDKNIMEYFDTFDKEDIRYMEAYPSTAYILARHLEHHNLYYDMKAIVTSSETLLPVQRDIIEERFRCKVFDYYGMAERVMFSGECEAHSGHHLSMEFGITEIVDEKYQTLPTGHYGKMILTGLHNYGMPLIRYDIGDVSALKEEECPCGRKLPLLQPVMTKAEDIIMTREGKLISSSVLTHPFKPLVNISKSQIIQEDYDHLLIKLVKQPGYSDNDTRRLLEGMHQRVGSGMKISIEFVSDIPVGANGKYRWVISKVPLKFGRSQIENLYSA